MVYEEVKAISSPGDVRQDERTGGVIRRTLWSIPGFPLSLVVLTAHRLAVDGESPLEQ